LTQFDAGKYLIPSIPVLVNGKPVFSDSIKVEVNEVKVDTLKQKCMISNQLLKLHQVKVGYGN